MATSVVERITCDGCSAELSGHPELVKFTYADNTFTLELCDKDRASFQETMDRYANMASGSTVAPKAKKTTAKAPKKAHANGNGASRDFDPAAVRAWAIENNIAVNSRGRVPAEIVAQYQAAS